MKRKIQEVSQHMRKIVAAGRGRVISHPKISAEIIKLTGKKKPNLVYLGVATYEDEGALKSQTSGFSDAGCAVKHVKLTQMLEKSETNPVATAFQWADIIAVSGGNTLFACKKFRKLGVDAMLESALDRGVVLCGGSAGAICWFDGGHSDSRDPITLRYVDDTLTEAQKKNWKYIRVSGLGFLPGLVCPHHDSTQSNGVPRSTDFDGMLIKKRQEVGVGIDDQAALLVDGDACRILATDGKSKVTKKVVKNGKIHETYFPPSSKLVPLSQIAHYY